MIADDLDDLERLLSRATDGPWFTRSLDDTAYMSAFTISTVSSKDDDYEQYAGGGWPAHELVAATLIQEPRLVGHQQARWEEDAELIVKLRNMAPQLIELARKGLEQS